MKKVLGFVIFVAIIAAIIWALLHFNILGGNQKDSKKGANDSSVSEIEVNVEATTAEDSQTQGAEITVSGHDYLFNNEKINLDDLAAEIGKLDKEAEIIITSDDTAAKNTVDELTDKLDELGYKNYKKLEK